MAGTSSRLGCATAVKKKWTVLFLTTYEAEAKVSFNIQKVTPNIQTISLPNKYPFFDSTSITCLSDFYLACI